MAFVTVYSRATGKKHRIPEHHLANPVLAKPWRKTPKTREAAETSATPATDASTRTSGPTDTPAAGDKE